MGILENIGDFRKLGMLSQEELELLCAELRKRIVDVSLANGGHMASSLGAVELIVALLRSFNPDRDKIIFDVGHQAYAYKMLTGRLDVFDSLRRKGGIAGFPRMNESPYDFFTVGHSSTSISAAIGYAKARDIKKLDHNVIAVIGDGALMNGVAFEALNCVQTADSRIIIVLNDNKMSISPRIGGFAGHLARLAVNPTYRRFKEFIKEQCRSVKNGGAMERRLSKIKSKLKSLLLPTNVFEEIDISYWGPFDGHNIAEMEEIFSLAKHYDKSMLIHVITKKGKGCPEAEEYPSFFHGVGPGTRLGDACSPPKTKGRSWSSVMADRLIKEAGHDGSITAATAAMSEGTKLCAFAERYPERFFDVGISEEHLIVYAAGLAAGGMKPVVCIYSTFLQRAMDQVMHDVCLSKLPVLIAVDRAGFVGEDGETHHGLFDIAWLRALPEITLAAPRDAVDLDFFVRGWLKRGIPMAIRYPRGAADERLCRDGEHSDPSGWGKAEILKAGEDVALIGMGSTVSLMLKAAEALSIDGISAAVIDLRFLKPIDFDTLEPILKKCGTVITAEEGALNGGAGEAIAAFANLKGYGCAVRRIGAPDRYISHASRQEQWEECGFTVGRIKELAGGR